MNYDLRVEYYLPDSKYSTEAYLYDNFSIRIVADCTDFTWTDTASTAPGDYTYTIYPTAVSATMTIGKPTVASTTCDNSPTVTWYYMEIGGNTWKTFTSNLDHAKSKTDTTVTFNSDVWEWGY